MRTGATPDTHFRVEGPVVGQMQAVFVDNWTKATGRVLDGAAYFPPLSPVGSQAAQMFSSSPTGGSESMHLMYLMAITAAQRGIHLSSAYFVPDQLTVDALVAAAKRGVIIEIITPGAHIDADVVRSASRARWGDLLKAGIRIAEFQPTMFHVMTAILGEQGRRVAPDRPAGTSDQGRAGAVCGGNSVPAHWIHAAIITRCRYCLARRLLMAKREFQTIRL